MNLNANRALHYAALAMITALVGCQTTAPTRSAAEVDVNRAQTTLENFRNDPQMSALQQQLKDAKAVIIAPSVTRAAFVVGGSGGQAIVLAREGTSTEWSGPAFYKLGAGSLGLQIGVDVSEIVMVVMSDKGLNALLSPKFTLGGDASVVAGPVGAAASRAVGADIVTFARSKGAYAGVSLAGAALRPDTAANEAYYGKSASPVDILVRRNVSNEASASLRQSLERMSG